MESSTSHTLACHLLYGLNLSYEEVLETSCARLVGVDGEVWEVEVATDFGVAIALRSDCPLAAAEAVAGKIIELVEAKRMSRDLAVN